MCHCDCDPPEFYNTSFVKARKPHRCCECCRTIEAGERYQSVTGKWEGDVDTYKTCSECLELIKQIDDDCCYCHGTLSEYAWQPEYDGEDWAKFREKIENHNNRVRAEKASKAC